MSDASGTSGEGSAGQAQRDADALAQLRAVREIIAGPADARAQEVQEQVGDTNWQRQTVAGVLASAVVVSRSKSDDLAKALAPTIQSAIRESVKRDPRPIVDAISPIMGPAIRKSIADALAALVQSFNEALESSFTVQGLKWRLEAMRTGRPYAEVVLLHRLVYRVEQVFLIHKETGLLLQHVIAQDVPSQDADMVSGMFTAVRDFAKDSFGVKDSGVALDEMRLGDDLYLLVKQGSSAYVAGIVRGKPNTGELVPLFAGAVESIHATYSNDLADFKGDPDVFVGARVYMEECLAKRQRTTGDAAKPFPFFRIAAWAVVLALLAWTIWFAAFWRNTPSAAWPAYIERLKAQPGIVVTGSGRDGDLFYVSVLRDPLSVDPVTLITAPLKPEHVEVRNLLYQSITGAFVIARANKALNPPDSVKLSFDEKTGVLRADGEATNRWITAARKAVQNVYGVNIYDDRAPHLVNPELDRLNDLKARLEALSVRFIFASSDTAPGQGDTIATIADLLFQLHDLAAEAGVDYQVQVAGHTDSSGDEVRNVRLSRDRADRMISLLVARGMNTRELTAVGVGPADPRVRQESAEKDREQNRRVSIKVLFLQQPLFLEEAQSP